MLHYISGRSKYVSKEVYQAGVSLVPFVTYPAFEQVVTIFIKGWPQMQLLGLVLGEGP